MKKFKLYSQLSILIFSILLTGFCGALMLAYNLRKVGKGKFAFPLVILTIVIDAMLFALAKVAIDDSLLRLLIPNVIAGCVLAYPIWNMYLTHMDEYEAKSPLIPVIAVVVLYGGLIAANVLVAR
jgi:hypothetical protein